MTKEIITLISGPVEELPGVPPLEEGHRGVRLRRRVRRDLQAASLRPHRDTEDIPEAHSGDTI